MAKLSKSDYDIHPSLAMVHKWIADMPEKTGHTLAQWLKRIEREAPPDLKGRQAWAKAETGMGAHAAAWLANRSLGSKEAFADEDPASYLRQAPKLVDAMYAGKKAALRPIFDALLAHAREALPDARVCPCSTMVPFYRTFVFAQVKPATNTRVDLGLALGAYHGDLPDFIIDTGGKAKKDRITHRIPLETPKDISKPVLKWLKAAYDLDAPTKGG
ncbi:MAG: DUF5655 domain-containing protein [Phycisphaerales bacterium]|jgi:hypothetical protein